MATRDGELKQSAVCLLLTIFFLIGGVVNSVTDWTDEDGFTERGSGGLFYALGALTFLGACMFDIVERGS